MTSASRAVEKRQKVPFAQEFSAKRILLVLLSSLWIDAINTDVDQSWF